MHIFNFNDKNIKRQIMLEHYQNPIYKIKKINLSDYQIEHLKSKNCIDDIFIYLQIKNNFVRKCFWNGEACVITASSTDILCKLITNKKIKEVNYLLNEYNKMINEKKFDENVLKEAVIFINTAKQPSRIKCATIGCNAIQNILKKNIKNEK